MIVRTHPMISQTYYSVIQELPDIISCVWLRLGNSVKSNIGAEHIMLSPIKQRYLINSKTLD